MNTSVLPNVPSRRATTHDAFSLTDLRRRFVDGVLLAVAVVVLATLASALS